MPLLCNGSDAQCFVNNIEGEITQWKYLLKVDSAIQKPAGIAAGSILLTKVVIRP